MDSDRSLLQYSKGGPQTFSIKGCALWAEWLCVFPTPISIHWNPNIQCDYIWRWGLWEWLGHEWEWSPHDGIYALIRSAPPPLFLSSVWEHNRNTAIWKPRRGPSPTTTPCWHHGIVILAFPASSTVRNTCVLFTPPNRWHLCYSSLNWLRQAT